MELKEWPTEGHEEIAYDVCDRVLKILDNYGYADRVVINTWSGKLHEYINKKYGKKYRLHSYIQLDASAKSLRTHIHFRIAAVCLQAMMRNTGNQWQQKRNLTRF